MGAACACVCVLLNAQIRWSEVCSVCISRAIAASIFSHSELQAQRHSWASLLHHKICNLENLDLICLQHTHKWRVRRKWRREIETERERGFVFSPVSPWLYKRHVLKINPAVKSVRLREYTRVFVRAHACLHWWANTHTTRDTRSQTNLTQQKHTCTHTVHAHACELVFSVVAKETKLPLAEKEQSFGCTHTLSSRPDTWFCTLLSLFLFLYALLEWPVRMLESVYAR